MRLPNYSFWHSLIIARWLFGLVEASPTWMAPSLERKRASETATPSTTDSTIASLVKQLSNPAEVLTVLLLVGGDVIQKAIAQVAGHNITPVCFSFGWVSYAFSALMVVFGDGLLLPESDITAKVIDAKNGNCQDNESWVIGRLIRDLELEVEKYYPDEMGKPRPLEPGRRKSEKTEELRVPEQAQRKSLDAKTKRMVDHQRLREAPLLITRWTASHICKQGRSRKGKNGELELLPDLPYRDAVWWSYFVILTVQFIIAAVPMMTDGMSGNWRVLFITAAGSFLALLTGSLPKWKQEKFACRMLEGPKTFVLTRGNNHRHAFVIEVSKEVRSLRMEDLAIRRRQRPSLVYQAMFAVLALAWVLLLITIGGLEDHTWYLFGVGLLGMAQNVLVAGVKRDSKAHGIPLELVPRIENVDSSPFVVEDNETVQTGKNNVMRALMAAERNQLGIGACLLPIFFPGELRPGEEEEDFWRRVNEAKNKKREEKRVSVREKRKLEGEKGQGQGQGQGQEKSTIMQDTIEKP